MGSQLTAEIMSIENLSDCDSIIQRAANVIKDGGIVVYPTDTSYGLGCDAQNADALSRLISVKRRDRQLGVPLLFSDISQCEVYHEFGTLETVIAKLFWPGALTLIVKPRPEIPEHITAGRDSIAIRVPNHIVPRGIAGMIGGPIVGTSANRSGGASPFDVSVALEQLGDEVDLYIDAGPSKLSENSTIIGVERAEETESLNIKVYREGALTINDLEANLKVDSDALRLWTTRIIFADM
ncbi:MAG: threonylcarbamoyl-AMP synthase [Candidatus Thorarchaeota archaeon]|nr:threonylcarbamoyl-AMP synthase [Candidatus Thorarchaeota archaeon]